MSETDVFVLGFDYEAVIGAWHDVRLAEAIERLWRSEGCPDGLRAWWAASAEDGYAFRWYVNVPLARVLDAASIAWRSFVIGRAGAAPTDARPFFSPAAAAPG